MLHIPQGFTFHSALKTNKFSLCCEHHLKIILIYHPKCQTSSDLRRKVKVKLNITSQGDLQGHILTKQPTHSHQK